VQPTPKSARSVGRKRQLDKENPASQLKTEGDRGGQKKKTSLRGKGEGKDPTEATALKQKRKASQEGRKGRILDTKRPGLGKIKRRGNHQRGGR